METSKFIARPVVAVNVNGCQCVDLVKQMRPDLSYISGYARTYLRQAKETSDVPTIGAVVQTNETFAGHVGMVSEMTATGIRIYERNVPWGNCANTYRWMDNNDPRIMGYIYQ